MTLLDYFAGQVATGLLQCGPARADAFALKVYDIATAMLTERERRMQTAAKPEPEKVQCTVRDQCKDPCDHKLPHMHTWACDQQCPRNIHVRNPYCLPVEQPKSGGQP